MKSIKHELIAVATLLLLIPVLITNLTYSYSFSNTIKSNIMNDNKRLCSTIADGVQNFIDKAYVLTEEMSQNKTSTDFNPQNQKDMLARGAANNPYFDLLYIQKSDGNQTARSSGDLGNRGNRWWFSKVMSDKKPFVSKSYYSVSNNAPVTSIFYPIMDGDSNVTGIFGADLKLGDLQKLVEKYASDKNNYAYVIDSEGVVIAHPDKIQVSEMYNYKTLKKSVLMKDSAGKAMLDESGNLKTKTEDIKVPEKLKEITEKALKGESGEAEYIDNNNKTIISSYSPVTLPGQSEKWAVVTVQDKDSALAVIKSTQIRNLIIDLVLVLMTSILIWLLSQKFTKPILNLMNLMEKASQGDLTVQANVNSKNELGRLGKSFNLMILNIQELIAHITEATNLVTQSSKSLVITTEETSKSIEEVSSNICEVASSSEKQASTAEIGLETTEKLSEEITGMVDCMKEGRDSANKVHAVSTKGIEVISALENVTTENNEAISNVVQVIDSLNERANAIGNIADAITSISEQTNLLALNAAIEAARAGEAGKGFSVVADEVRKLSENTADSSSNVKEIVSTVQKDINVAIAAIHQAELAVGKQNDAVSFTKDTFNEILRNIEDVVNKILTTSSSLDSVVSSRSQLLSVMNEVSSISGNLAASSEQVSAITEEQNAAVEEISSLSEELNRMAQMLEESIRTFKIK